MKLEKILEKIAKNKQVIQENNKEIQENNKRLQKLHEETEKQMAKSDRKLDRIAKLHGDVVNSIGEVAEEYFYQRLKSNKNLGKIHFDDVSQNVKRERGEVFEYDIVMYNDTSVGIVEVKNKLRKDDVVEFLENQLANYKKEFPAYSEKNLYGAIVGMKVYKDAQVFAEKQGLFILTQSNNRLKNINSRGFEPIAR